MFKHAAAGARRRWPVLLFSLVSVSALALSAFTLLASADEGPSPAVVSKSISNVPTGKAEGVDATGQVCTVTGTGFTDMPAVGKLFTQGGTVAKPVIVLFQGELSNFAQGATVFIRLVIDGAVQSGPSLVGVAQRPSANPFGFETHGYNFVSDPVTPGTHFLAIQWRDNTFGSGCVGNRSLIVFHK